MDTLDASGPASCPDPPSGRRPRSSWLAPLLGADLRSLALLRVALAGIVLVDLGLRATDLSAHYTDQGVLPRADLIALCEEPTWFCLHMASGRWEFQALLFVLAGLAALALLLGWRTRLASIVSWVFLCSLQERNPMVLNSGDVLLRMLLLWGIFLPWGERWSLDRRGKPAGANLVCSAGTAAYLGQVILLYLAAGLHKWGDPWRNGLAVYYTLSIDQMTTPLAQWTLQHHELMTALTFATVLFQRFLFVLLLCPVANGLTRTLAVLGTVIFHVGIALHLHLGIFTAVAIVAAWGLLPGAFWDFLARRSPAWLRTRIQEPCSAEVPPPTEPLPVRALALLLLAGCVLWNAGNLWSLPLKPSMLLVPRVLRLDQQWGMFAPQPMTDDGWFVLKGTLANGKEVDLRTAGDLSWAKPERLADTYPNERWRKYTMNLGTPEGRMHRQLYCRYLAERWNAAHRGPWRVEVVDLFFMLEQTRPDYTSAPPRQLLLCHYVCPPETHPNGFEELFGK